MVGKDKSESAKALQPIFAAGLIWLAPFIISACNQPPESSVNSKEGKAPNSETGTVSSSVSTAVSRSVPSADSNDSSSGSNATQPVEIIAVSPEAITNAGIKSQPIKEMSYESDIKTTGELKADENNVFHINSMVAGRITVDKVNLGDFIRQGQTLAIVQNKEVTKLIGDYIHQKHSNEIQADQLRSRLELANKNLDRLNKLSEEGIAPLKDVLTAKNQVDQLTIELRGIKEHNVHLNSETDAMLSTYGKHLTNYDNHKIESESPLTAPRAGVVIKKSITLGDVVNTSEPLYVVADLSDIWLDVTIYDKDLAQVKIGQKVTFISDSLGGRKFDGKISYIQPLAGDASRTFLARAVLPNRQLALKPGMFGTAIIHTQRKEYLPYVADNSVQRYGKDIFVFEDLGAGKYAKRPIELGERLLDGYLVKSGIKSGALIVNSGSLTLKAEFLKRLNGAHED